MAAARATETFRPARLEKIVPTLLVCAEPRLEAWQVGRKIGRQHAMPSRLLGSILSQRAENSSLKVAERQFSPLQFGFWSLIKYSWIILLIATIGVAVWQTTIHFSGNFYQSYFPTS